MTTTLATENRVQILDGNSINIGTAREMKLFATKISLLSKIFGCGHGDLSRPFSHGNVGYRSCLKCGAVKRFNPETLKTFGEFYYPSVAKAGIG